jgi:alkanesulfonate monooxygenase SsuD/methylene tetrahydromethanopterin reductase-like flavin-dependent oxidoreductase (luciferase family)
VDVELATLYTRPHVPPPLFAAAITPVTARWAGGWADGLITTARPPSELAEVVDAFRAGGGEEKPMYLKVQLSWDRDERRALEGAHAQWAANVFPSAVLSDLRSPCQFEQLAPLVTPDELRAQVRVSSDLEQHIEWLRGDLSLGFSHLYLHNVNRGQEAFIDAFGERVLPALCG